MTEEMKQFIIDQYKKEQICTSKTIIQWPDETDIVLYGKAQYYIPVRNKVANYGYMIVEDDQELFPEQECNASYIQIDEKHPMYLYIEQGRLFACKGMRCFIRGVILGKRQYSERGIEKECAIVKPTYEIRRVVE